MGITLNCIDRFGMRKLVPYIGHVDDSFLLYYLYGDDVAHDVYDDDPQRGL